MKPVRLLVIGDPHGSEKLTKLDLRGYDAAIVTGDMGKADLMRSIALGKTKPKKNSERDSFMQSVGSAIPVMKHISSIPTFCVYGNVETSDEHLSEINRKFHSKIPLFGKELSRMGNVYVLDHAAAKFKGITIAGLGYFLETRWVQEFSESPDIIQMLAAAIDESAAREFFNAVGKVDIMLTHQPPYGVLDIVKERFVPKKWKGKHAGSVMLLDYIKKYHPRYVICGHVHEDRGIRKIGKTTVINAGCCGSWQRLIVGKQQHCHSVRVAR